ncbi:ester cyclase [Parasphingopyxis marina]|uniref:Ester cyclase n=1 Tax=Parasphingopyxis marina TaxID=2761622 RepID=A0A842HXG9_9SPHN|nr:ester cyclase [Parasphingopyxis marina]MBC2777031.1 ester cyclase [Parasphingopyxis marina]
MSDEKALLEANKAAAAVYYAKHAEPVEVSMAAISKDVIYHGRADSPPSLDMWIEREIRFRKAMSDIETTVHRQTAEGDMVATHWTLEATHSGRLMDYEASGKRIKMASMCFDRVVDGLVVEHWGVRDLLNVLRTIGAVAKFTPKK